MNPIRITVLLTMLIVLVVACFRYEKIWSGAEFDSTGGKTLRLASDEPFCGCIDLSNRSSDAILLRSRVGELERGHALLEAGEKKIYKFDWAGPDYNDVFTIDVFTASKPHTRLEAEDVLTVNSYTWPFHQCDDTRCDWEELLMNTGSLNIIK